MLVRKQEIISFIRCEMTKLLSGKHTEGGHFGFSPDLVTGY